MKNTLLTLLIFITIGALGFTLYDPYYSLGKIREGLARRHTVPVLKQIHIKSLQVNLRQQLIHHTQGELHPDTLDAIVQESIHPQSITYFVKASGRIQGNSETAENPIIRAHIGAANYFLMRDGPSRAALLSIDTCGYQGLSVFRCDYTLDSNIKLALVFGRIGLDWQLVNLFVLPSPDDIPLKSTT